MHRTDYDDVLEPMRVEHPATGMYGLLLARDAPYGRHGGLAIELGRNGKFRRFHLRGSVKSLQAGGEMPKHNYF